MLNLVHTLVVERRAGFQELYAENFRDVTLIVVGTQHARWHDGAAADVDQEQTDGAGDCDYAEERPWWWKEVKMTEGPGQMRKVCLYLEGLLFTTRVSLPPPARQRLAHPSVLYLSQVLQKYTSSHQIQGRVKQSQ